MEYMCCELQISSIPLNLATLGCIHFRDIFSTHVVCLCVEGWTEMCSLLMHSVQQWHKTVFSSKLSFQWSWMTKMLDCLYYVLPTSSPFRNDPTFCGYFRPPPQTKIKTVLMEDGTSEQYQGSALPRSCWWRAVCGDSEAITSSASPVQADLRGFTCQVLHASDTGCLQTKQTSSSGLQPGFRSPLSISGREEGNL